MNNDTAVLVIDMQHVLVTGAFEEVAVISAVNLVIQKAREAGLPIFFIQHNHSAYEPMKKDSPGWQVHASLDKQDSDPTIDKEASDAFFETDLYERLIDLGVGRVIITGMQTEYCVDATCRSALSHKLDVLLVADGHTTGPSHLPAETIIDHHNRILANLAHPSSTLTVLKSSEISFQEG